MTDRLEMDPDLVSSSGEDLAKDQGPTTRFLNDFELSLSWPPTIDNSHFLTVHGMTANRLDNFAGRCNEFSGAQRQVEFLNLSSGELATQPQMREIVLRDHKTTAGLFVESMHHSRPKLAADAAQVFGMMKQRVNEGARLYACSGVNRHACRFVDNQEMFILEQDGQCNILGPQVDRFRFRFRNRYFIPWADNLLGAASCSVH
jgi:hypothetical protein